MKQFEDKNVDLAQSSSLIQIIFCFSNISTPSFVFQIPFEMTSQCLLWTRKLKYLRLYLKKKVLDKHEESNLP